MNSKKQKTISFVEIKNWVSCICPICGKPFWVPKGRIKYRKRCSLKCYATHKKTLPPIKHTDETKKKMSLSKTGNKNPQFGKKGENSTQWKGGRIIDERGYVLVYSPEHPYPKNDNYVYEHRLIMEKICGRYLDPKIEVHHINGDKSDNRPENLELMTGTAHRKLHSKEQNNRIGANAMP